MNILEVKNLTKTYGKGNTLVKALDDVSFEVEQGEFVAIIGPFRLRKIHSFAYSWRRGCTDKRSGDRRPDRYFYIG